jgi:hypothetical protein
MKMVESSIEFYMINFFHLVMMNQFWNMNICSEVNFVRSMIRAMHHTLKKNELEQRQKWMEEIEEIWNKTNDEINTKLTVVEIAYNKNVMKGFNKMIEIQNNDGIWIEFNTAQLYDHLKIAESKLVSIVVTIVSYYKLVIPVQSSRGGLSPGFQLKSGT